MQPDDLAAAVLDLYHSLTSKRKPPHAQFTILASFILSAPNTSEKQPLKIISLSTGSKCLPAIRLPPRGDALHDSHAEVLARRGAVRWFLEEIRRLSLVHAESDWIIAGSDRRYRLQDGIRIHLYISTIPCGDASTRFLASFQDEEMAALKDSTIPPPLPPNTASRGRDNYSLYGVLRTKPGRADSPPTLSMSCSDKIASWSVLGIQGALGSYFLSPLYISDIIIGEVEEAMSEIIRGDCEKAFFGRLTGLEALLPHHFKLHTPAIHFTRLSFPHSRTSLASTSSCNESLCWVADSPKPPEVLINGIKRGVSPKHREKEKFRPLLSKISFFHLYRQLSADLGRSPEPGAQTYFEIKHAMHDFQSAKNVLMGDSSGPFAGWIKSGKKWEGFNVDGECC